MDKLMLTPEEAAEALGVGRSTLYDLLRLQEIPSVKIGRSRRIPVSALREFADRLATAAVAR
jgi:excisionase family DNA binding protein